MDRRALNVLPRGAASELDPNRLRAALDRAGVPDRMPFLISDDGYISVRKFNDFFRDLPLSGCSSPETWWAYGLDVFRFIRYVSSEEVGPFNPAVIPSSSAIRRARSSFGCPRLVVCVSSRYRHGRPERAARCWASAFTLAVVASRTGRSA